MYNVIFYENSKGESELWDYLENLREKSLNEKNARIQYKQILFYIELLQKNGTRLGDNITKHLDDGIWELRPGSNRVLYFFFQDKTFVLLHSFQKKTQRTPKREIYKAKYERADFIKRKENV